MGFLRRKGRLAQYFAGQLQSFRQILALAFQGDAQCAEVAADEETSAQFVEGVLQFLAAVFLGAAREHRGQN